MGFRDPVPLKQAIAEVKKQYKSIQTGEKYVPTKNAENRNEFSILLNTFRHKIFNQCIDAGLRNYRCCQVFLQTFYQECIACWKHICDEKSLQKKVKTYSIYFRGELLLLLKFRTKNDELIILVFTEEVLPIIVQLKKKYQKKVRSTVAEIPSLIVKIKRCSLPKSLMDDIDYDVLNSQAKMYGPSIQQIVERYLIPEMNKPNVIKFKQPTYSTYKCTFITTCDFDVDENENLSTDLENLKFAASLNWKGAVSNVAVVSFSDAACNAPISDAIPKICSEGDTACNAPPIQRGVNPDTACKTAIPDPVVIKASNSLKDTACSAPILDSVSGLNSPKDAACAIPISYLAAGIISPMDTVCNAPMPDPITRLRSPTATACNATIPNPVATTCSHNNRAYNATIPDPVASASSPMDTACHAPVSDPLARPNAPKDAARNAPNPDSDARLNSPKDIARNTPNPDPVAKPSSTTDTACIAPTQDAAASLSSPSDTVCNTPIPGPVASASSPMDTAYNAPIRNPDARLSSPVASASSPRDAVRSASNPYADVCLSSPNETACKTIIPDPVARLNSPREIARNAPNPDPAAKPSSTTNTVCNGPIRNPDARFSSPKNAAYNASIPDPVASASSPMDTACNAPIPDPVARLNSPKDAARNAPNPDADARLSSPMDTACNTLIPDPVARLNSLRDIARNAPNLDPVAKPSSTTDTVFNAPIRSPDARFSSPKNAAYNAPIPDPVASASSPMDTTCNAPISDPVARLNSPKDAARNAPNPDADARFSSPMDTACNTLIPDSVARPNSPKNAARNAPNPDPVAKTSSTTDTACIAPTQDAAASLSSPSDTVCNTPIPDPVASASSPMDTACNAPIRIPDARLSSPVASASSPKDAVRSASKPYADVCLSSPNETACNTVIPDPVARLNSPRDIARNAPNPDPAAKPSSTTNTVCNAPIRNPDARFSSPKNAAYNAPIPDPVASASSPMDTACNAPIPDPVNRLNSPKDAARNAPNPDPVAKPSSTTDTACAVPTQDAADSLSLPSDTVCSAPIADSVASLGSSRTIAYNPKIKNPAASSSSPKDTIYNKTNQDPVANPSSTKDTAYNARIPHPIARLSSPQATACNATIPDADTRPISLEDITFNDMIPDIVSSYNMLDDHSADAPDNVLCNIPTLEKNQSPKVKQVLPGDIQTHKSTDLKNDHQINTFGQSELSLQIKEIDKKIAELRAKPASSKTQENLSANSIGTIQSAYSDPNLAELGTCDIQKMCLFNSCCGSDLECNCITRKLYHPKHLNYIIVRLQLVLEPNKKNWKMTIRNYLYDSFFEETYKTGEFPKYQEECQGSIRYISLREIFKMSGSGCLLKNNCITVISYKLFSSWMNGRWVDLDASVFLIVYENCYERLSDTNVVSMNSLELDQTKFENILARLLVAVCCSKSCPTVSMTLRVIALRESQGVPVFSDAKTDDTASSESPPKRIRCHSVGIQTDSDMNVPFIIDCIAGIRGIMNEVAACNDHLLKSLKTIYDTSFISRMINLQNATSFETNNFCMNILSDRSVSILLKRTDEKVATFSTANLDNRIDHVFDGYIGWSNAEENAECYESLYYKKMEAAKIVTENDFPTSNVAKKKIGELVDETIFKNNWRVDSRSTPVLWITSKNLELATISSNPANKAIYFVFNKNVHTKYCVDNIYFPHSISSAKIYNTKFGTFNTIATEVQRTSKVILRLSQCSTPFLIMVSDAYVFNTKIVEQYKILTQLKPINATPIQDQKKNNMESTSNIPMEMYGRDQRTRRQTAIKPPNFYTEHKDYDILWDSSRNMPDSKKTSPVDEGRLDISESVVPVKNSASHTACPEKDTREAFKETDSASNAQRSDYWENTASNSTAIKKPAKKRIRYFEDMNENEETEQPTDTVVKNPADVNTQIEPDVQMQEQSNSTDEIMPETNSQLAEVTEIIQADIDPDSIQNCSWTIDNAGNYVNSKSACRTGKLNTRVKDSLPLPKRYSLIQANSREIRAKNDKMFLERKQLEFLHRNDVSMTSNKAARHNLKQKEMDMIRLGGSPHSLGAGFLKQKPNLMAGGLDGKSSGFNKKIVCDSGSTNTNDNVEENVQNENEVTPADAIEQHEKIVIDGDEIEDNCLSKQVVRGDSSSKATSREEGAKSNMEERLGQKENLNEEQIGQDELNNNVEATHNKKLLTSNPGLANKYLSQSKYATKNLLSKEHDCVASKGHIPPVSNIAEARDNLVVNNESDINVKTLVRIQDPGNNALTIRENVPNGDQYAPVEVNIIKAGKISQQIIYEKTSNGNNAPKQKIVDHQLVTMRNNTESLYEKCKLLNALALKRRMSMFKEVDKLSDKIDNNLVKLEVQGICHPDMHISKIINVPTTSPYPLEMKDLKPQISSDIATKPDNIQDDIKNIQVNTLDTKNVQVNTLDTKKVEPNQISNKVDVKSGGLNLDDVPLLRDIKRSPTSVSAVHTLRREIPIQTISQPSCSMISTQSKKEDINNIRREVAYQTIVQPACTVSTTQTKHENINTLQRAMPMPTTGQPAYTLTSAQVNHEQMSTSEPNRRSFIQGSCLASLIGSPPQSEPFQTSVKPKRTYPYFDTSGEESNGDTFSAIGIAYTKYLKENMSDKQHQDQRVVSLHSPSGNSMAAQSVIAGPSTDTSEQTRRNLFIVPANIPCKKRPNTLEPESTPRKMPALALITNPRSNVNSPSAPNTSTRMDTPRSPNGEKSYSTGSTGLIQNSFPIYSYSRNYSILGNNFRPNNAPASLSSQSQQTPTSGQHRQRTQMSATSSRFSENNSPFQPNRSKSDNFQNSSYTAPPQYFMNNHRHDGQAYQIPLPQNYINQYRLQNFSGANALGQEQFLSESHNETNFARQPVQQMMGQHTRNQPGSNTEPSQRRYSHAPAQTQPMFFHPIDLQRIRASTQNIQNINQQMLIPPPQMPFFTPIPIVQPRFISVSNPLFQDPYGQIYSDPRQQIIVHDRNRGSQSGQFFMQPEPNSPGRIQSYRHMLPEFPPYPHLVRSHHQPDMVYFSTDGSAEHSQSVHRIPSPNIHHHAHRIIENRAGPSNNVMIPTPYNNSRIMDRHHPHFSNATIRPQLRENSYQVAPSAQVASFIESSRRYSVEGNSADVSVVNLSNNNDINTLRNLYRQNE